jgi:peptidyl-tRNA hydrolase, PTH1 family
MSDENLVWLAAGLGNPGRRYEGTRHNIGFMVVEELAERYRVELREYKKEIRIGRGSIEGRKILLMEPLLFMNLSGPPIRSVLLKSEISSDRLIVVHDDLDMETGRIRIRRTGSSGGHKGIASIIDSVGTRDFIRVKIGIGRTPGVPSEDYVLTRFRKNEAVSVREAVVRASEAVASIVVEGIDSAMNTYNVRTPPDA